MQKPTQDDWSDLESMPGMSNAEGVEFSEEWADLDTEPSLTDKAVAIGKGAVGGLQEMGGLVGGAITGARVGSIAGPYGTASGAVIGGVSGLLLGTEARDMSVGRLEDLPPELRPYMVFGETTTGAMVPGGTAVWLGKNGVRMGNSIVGKFFNRILDTAERSPKAFLTTEGGMAASSGLWGAGSEYFDPGDTLTRMGAEAIGGYFNLTRLTHFASRKALEGVNRMRSLWSTSARETQAGKILNDALNMAGEDPVVVAHLLREADFLQVLQPANAPAVPRTASQKTGSVALAALEKRIAQTNPDFFVKAGGAAEENLEAIRRLIDYTSRVGDPAALKVAAEMRRDYFKVLVSSRLKQAEAAAIKAANAVASDFPEKRSALSKKAAGLLDTAIEDLSKTMKALWEDVPENLTGGHENLKNRLKFWKGELIPEQTKHIPSVVGDFLSRISEDGAVTTVRDLKGIRSELLAVSRAAQTDPARRLEAKIAGELAEAALDDMMDIPAATEAYETARTFTREYNDAFLRSIVGKITADTKYGPRVPPELLAKRVMASGEEATELYLQDLTDAVQFMIKYSDSPDMILKSGKMMDDMLGVQEQLIRLAAAKSRTIDPKTGLPGKVSVSQLGKFIENNKDGILAKFPTVRADLEEALTSEIARKRILDVTEGRSKIVNQKAAFAELVKGDPINVMEKMLYRTTMERELKSYIKIAKGRAGGPDSISGLQASILEAAIRKSTTRGGNFSLPEFKTALFEPPTPGGKSVIQILQESGVMGGDTVTLLTKVLSEADKILKTKNPAMVIEEVEDAPGFIYDMITRIAGASVAGKLAKSFGAGDHGLIAAQRGSSAARSIVQKLPNVRIQAVLADLLANRPEIVADLIERVPSPEKELRAAQLLHGYLITSGAMGATDYIYEPEAEPITAP